MVSILSLHSKYYFLDFWLLSPKIYVGNISLEDRSSRCFGRIRISFRSNSKHFSFSNNSVTKVVYFSQINQIHCRALITALDGVKIKCYLPFMLVRNTFISLLEIFAFQ
jgi:hypothetical protein